MKMIKMALLGGAALAVTTAAAKADDLSALKAQIESLNARVAQMEAAPAVPSGYNLITMSEAPATVVPGAGQKDDKAYLPNANVISVLPTADAPASATIEWSGYVYAIVQYYDNDNAGDNSDMDVYTRGQLKVVGKTDTAVGEVGVEVRLRAGTTDVLDVRPAFSSPKYWGWWAMTPELSLAGGYAGSLGNVGYGYDGACTCWGTDNADVAFNPGDSHQLALLYASGPFSAGIALEDATNQPHKFGGAGDSLGVAGNIKYAGDTFNGGLFGVWHDGGAGEDAYQVGAGLGLTFDPVSLSLAGAMGQINNGQDFWGVSALASVSLSDEFHGELGAGYKNYDGRSTPAGAVTQDDKLAIMAGLYYTPVDQLTLGIEGEYVDHQDSNVRRVRDAGDEWFADFVAVWSF